MTPPPPADDRRASTLVAVPGPGGGKGGLAIAAIVLVLSAPLLFWRLGRPALWDDEAMTALAATNLWRTGDSTAVCDDGNLVAYRNGAELRGLKHRMIPPLSYYLVAPSIGLLGGNALAARLPFAVAGWVCIAWILAWLHRERTGVSFQALWALALLGNVSFFLYFRQCRYYGPAMLATVALAYSYRFRDGSRWNAIGIIVASVCLMATSYLNYAAAVAALGLDYALWGRRERPFARSAWISIVLAQAVVGIPLALTWNPLDKRVVDYHPESWRAEKATLLRWNLRDLNEAEFAPLALLAAAPLLAFLDRGRGLLRGTVMLLAYVAAITLASPQPVGLTRRADIRYLAPAIPLAMAIGVRSLHVLGSRLPRGAVWPLAFAAFGTNLLHGGPFAKEGARSTVAEYVRELAGPASDPYTEVARWIAGQVPRGRSIWVQPGHMVYPLMFHAPGRIYAWQLDRPQGTQFRGLPPIHFLGRAAPDYIIAFGPPGLRAIRQTRLAVSRDYAYETFAVIDAYWLDRNRPELFWHDFRPKARYQWPTEAITVFRKSRPGRLQPARLGATRS